MGNGLQIALRVTQLIFTITITGLIGNVIASAFAGNPSSINYAIFVAAFSWLVLIFGLAAAFVESLAIPVVMWALDGLATIFTFIAGVVLAAKLGVHSCGNHVSGNYPQRISVFLTHTQSYTRSNSLTNGSNNQKARCQELQCATAFFWFLFAAYVASMVATGLSHSNGVSMSRRGGIRKGGPS